MPPSFPHPLASALTAAAGGRFPPVDGVVEVVAPDEAGTSAVVEFTGHSYLLTDRGQDDPLFAGIDAFGGATDPWLLAELAGPCGQIGSFDMVMARRAGISSAASLPATDRFDEHSRVQRARRHRRDVTVFGDERGLICVGTGLVGRAEISVELMSGSARGSGRELVRGGLANLAQGELVFAQVSPGNAASVRMFLACGFVPIGSEVLFEPGSV